MNRINDAIILCLSAVSVFSAINSPTLHAQSRSLAPAKKGLLRVPLPELKNLDEPVAAQIKSLQQEFTFSLAAGELTDKQLGEAYAALGQLYHAYEFIGSAEACYHNATQLMPSDFRPFHLLGTLSQQTGKLREARENLAKVRELQPDYAPAAARLGDVDLQLNQLASARSQFDSALKYSPQMAAAYAGLGDVALAEKKYFEAIHQYQKALELAPTANRLYYSLGLAYRGANDTAKARAALDQRGIVNIRPADPLIDVLPSLLRGERVHVARGRQAFEARRYQEAAESFAKAVEAKPDSVRARVNLGASLVQLGDVNGAAAQFDAALKLEPENQTARFNLGVLLLRQEKIPQAIEQLEAVFQANSKDADAARELARALVKAEQTGTALTHYQIAVALRPEDETTLLEFADLAIAQELYQTARDALDDSLRRFPERGLTMHALAKLLATCPDESIREGGRAVDLAQKVYAAQNSPPHAETLAQAFAEAGKCEEAAAIQKQLVAIAEKLPNETLAARLREQLVRYEKGAPCRPPIGDAKQPAEEPTPAEPESAPEKNADETNVAP